MQLGLNPPLLPSSTLFLAAPFPLAYQTATCRSTQSPIRLKSWKWFDLLMVEVQKLEETVVTGPSKQTLEPKSDLGTEPAPKPEISPHSPTNSSHTPDISPSPSPRRKPSKLQLPSLQSSQLAAAIVNSAPQERRAIYLKSSSSFDVAEPTLPLPHLNDAALK